MNNAVVACSNLSKSYHDGKLIVDVLNGIDFTVKAGERVAIVGPSGSGKSTLLHLLGGLDKPSGGSVLINGEDWQPMNEKKRCQTRNKNLGFIYQFHHLLPEFSALENVTMPLLLANKSTAHSIEIASEMLMQVGLGHRMKHKPSQLSGGERQRVAIARALVNRPHCVFADEPTGNLDQSTAEKVFDLMLAVNAKLNTSLVIVTHDMRLASRMDVVVCLEDGQLK